MSNRTPLDAAREPLGYLGFNELYTQATRLQSALIHACEVLRQIAGDRHAVMDSISRDLLRRGADNAERIRDGKEVDEIPY